jgi:hypothetical protein
MPGSHSSVTLHVQPDTLPSVRAAVDETLTELGVHLARLSRAGFIFEPWLGDQVSDETQAHYNTRVMEAPDGPMAALLAYQAELIRIRDTLQVMEDQYLRAEGEIAGGLGRV